MHRASSIAGETDAGPTTTRSAPVRLSTSRRNSSSALQVLCQKTGKAVRRGGEA